MPAHHDGGAVTPCQLDVNRSRIGLATQRVAPAGLYSIPTQSDTTPFRSHTDARQLPSLWGASRGHRGLSWRRRLARVRTGGCARNAAACILTIRRGTSTEPGRRGHDDDDAGPGGLAGRAGQGVLRRDAGLRALPALAPAARPRVADRPHGDLQPPSPRGPWARRGGECARVPDVQSVCA